MSFLRMGDDGDNDANFEDKRTSENFSQRATYIGHRVRIMKRMALMIMIFFGFFLVFTILMIFFLGVIAWKEYPGLIGVLTFYLISQLIVVAILLWLIFALLYRFSHLIQFYLP